MASRLRGWLGAGVNQTLVYKYFFQNAYCRRRMSVTMSKRMISYGSLFQLKKKLVFWSSSGYFRLPGGGFRRSCQSDFQAKVFLPSWALTTWRFRLLVLVSRGSYSDTFQVASEIWCSGNEMISQMLYSLSKRLGKNAPSALFEMVIGFKFSRPFGVDILHANCPTKTGLLVCFWRFLQCPT